MLRRSLLIFSGFVFVALAATVGYALAGLAGPDTAIAEAERLHAAGRPAAALKALGIAERDLGQADTGLRARLLRLRHQIHIELGDPKQALAALEDLRLLLPGKEHGLDEERIAFLINLGRADEALVAAERLLAGGSPNPGRAEELAGEANQAVYQRLLAKLREDLAGRLPAQAQANAMRALRLFLYRPAGDPASAQARDRFAALLKEHDGPAYYAQRHAEALAAIQTRIDAAQAHFRKALELPGTPVGAFEGLAFALEQAGRDDELLALAEIYLRRFDHHYTTLAANRALQAHLRHGRHAAALELAERHLPLDGALARLQRIGLHPSVQALLVGRQRAQLANADQPACDRTTHLAYALQAKQVQMLPGLHRIHAASLLLSGDDRNLLTQLAAYCNYPEVRALPAEGEDELAEVMRLRLAAAERLGGRLEDLNPIYLAWMQDRPSDPEPHLLRSRMFITRGEGALALGDAQNGIRRAQHAEAALHTLAEAADLAYGAQNRGAPAMLQQCLARQQLLPEDLADEVLLLPLGELALRLGHDQIADAAAARAQSAFSWARWPRLLRAAVALARGDGREAGRVLDPLLAEGEAEPRLLELLRRSRLAADSGTADLQYLTFASEKPEADLLRSLFARALAASEPAALQALVGCAAAWFPTEPEFELLTARALLALGTTDPGRNLLVRLLQTLPDADPIKIRAMREFVRHCVLTRDRERLQAALPVAARLLAGAPDATLEQARLLQDHGFVREAYGLLRPVLDAETQDRSGRHFLRAGELAAALGEIVAAEDHWTAALSFPDGAAAALPLAALCATQGRNDEAEQIARDLRADDLAAACLLARLRRQTAVMPFVRQAGLRTPDDLPLACLRALVDPEAQGLRAALADLVEVASTQRDRVLELLTLVSIPGLENLGHGLAVQLLADPKAGRTLVCLAALAARRAGRPGDALQLLLPWTAKEPEFVCIFDELAAVTPAVQATGLPASLFTDMVVAATTRMGARATPRMIALSADTLAKQVAAVTKDARPALELLARAWNEHPRETAAGLPQVEVLLAAGMVRDGLQLLDVLEPLAQGQARAAFLQAYFAVARRLLAAGDDPALRARFVQRAQAICTTEVPYASALHFWLDHDPLLRPATRQDQAGQATEANTRRLLLAQVELHLSGRDPDPEALAATLTRLAGGEVREDSLARVCQLLRRDPTLLPVWELRAEYEQQLGRKELAQGILRTLYRLTRNPRLLLAAGRIAGENSLPAALEAHWLETALDAATKATPQAAYVRGLLALRAARYAEAAELLAAAAPQPDQAELFFVALANLSLRQPEAKERALAAFTRLAASGSARFAANAAHFAQQLAVK